MRFVVSTFSLELSFLLKKANKVLWSAQVPIGPLTFGINPHTGGVILVWVLKMLFLWNYPILSVKTEEIPFLILGPAAV